MEVWKIIFLSKWVICRFHVNLPGCTWRSQHVEYLDAPIPPLFLLVFGVQVDWSRHNYESSTSNSCTWNSFPFLQETRLPSWFVFNLDHNSFTLFPRSTSLQNSREVILMTEFWKWSFPEFSWLFLSSLVCFTDVKNPCRCMQRSRCRGGTRNANWRWSNSMQVGWWAGILELFTNWQLFHGFEYWVMLNWMQSLVRHVLKNPHWPWKKMKEVAEMVDPWHGIYHWWWGNAIHSKKQRFGPVRSKSAGALVSRQGNMMVEEGPWWMVMSSFDRVSRNVNYCPWNYGL